jgi:hypothetical protein
MPNIINIPGVGDICLVDREQLRFRSHGRQFAFPSGLRAFANPPPLPPLTWDWSKGEAVVFPILGNDRYGDCYMAAAAHLFQAMTGSIGTEVQFDVNALTARYLVLSGGDNGLDDGTILPEMKSGYVGPNGPNKILDEMTVDFTNQANLDLALWAYSGGLWTCSLLNTWLDATKPGTIWDSGGRPDRAAGHAMCITGKKTTGTYDVRTWGISPPIELTYAGLKAADSEIVVCFSMESFNAAGYNAAGLHYTTAALLWQSMGGQTLPASPFPPPGPDVIDWTPTQAA